MGPASSRLKAKRVAFGADKITNMSRYTYNILQRKGVYGKDVCFSLLSLCTSKILYEKKILCYKTLLRHIIRVFSIINHRKVFSYCCVLNLLVVLCVCDKVDIW